MGMKTTFRTRLAAAAALPPDQFDAWDKARKARMQADPNYGRPYLLQKRARPMLAGHTTLIVHRAMMALGHPAVCLEPRAPVPWVRGLISSIPGRIADSVLDRLPQALTAAEADMLRLVEAHLPAADVADYHSRARALANLKFRGQPRRLLRHQAVQHRAITLSGQPFFLPPDIVVSKCSPSPIFVLPLPCTVRVKGQAA